MKIKLLLLLLLLRVRSKKNNTGGGKEHAFLSEYGYSTGCPNLMRRGLQYSSTRVTLIGTVGVFSAPPPPPPPPPNGFCEFSCQKQKNQHKRGGGKEHNFLSKIWVQQGVSQLSATRIAGRWGTPLMWGIPHVHLISPTVTPPIKQTRPN